jgi:RHS repeat-associated protein
LGTVKDWVNSSGSVVNHVVYDSFGGVVSQSNSAFGSRYGFTGRELDGETGLYYYRSRYYNAGIGRFIGEDSVGFGGGDANLYRYVGNSPVDSIDPSGQLKIEFRYRSAVPFNAANHADVVVTDDNGLSTAYWARAENVEIPNMLSKGFGNLTAARSKKGAYKPGYLFYVSNSNNIQLLYEDKNDCKKQEHQDIEDKIYTGFKNIQAAAIGYNPLTTNSNSAAFQVIRDIGIVNNLIPKPGVNPIGWDINPYTWDSRVPTPQPGPFPPI